MNFENLDFNSSKPLYSQISEMIRERIIKNELPVGEKLPPQRKLCQTFGVSNDTMQEAINKLAEEGYVSGRTRHGTVVISSEPRPGLGLSRKNGICLVVCSKTGAWTYDFNNVMLQMVIKSVQEKVKEKGAYLVSTILNEDEDEVSIGGKEREIAGLIVTGAKTPHHMNVVRKLKIPFVLIGDMFNQSKTHEDFDLIANNDFEGAYLAAKHLAALGHKRIAYCHEPIDYPWDTDKLAGYKKALEEAGIAFDEKLMIKFDKMDSETAYKAMTEFLDKQIPFTGLISSGINTIHGIIQALQDKKLRIPEDISLVDSGASEYTHVFYDLEELGRVAFDRLYYRLTDANWKPERIIVQNSFFEGHSTRKI
jgi:DNA-binding LacI/PurR family transcriptional regulator